MGYATSLDMDWDMSDGAGLAEELEFLHPETSTTLAQQKELEEFLRDFQDSEPAWELLGMGAPGESETEF